MKNKWGLFPNNSKKPTSTAIHDIIHAEYQRKYVKTHHEEVKKRVCVWQKQRNRELRLKIIEFLGGKCIKCGYSGIAIQIDHVCGGETSERKHSTNSYAYYLNIFKKIQSGSKDYQLLCANCNWEKRIILREDVFR